MSEPRSYPHAVAIKETLAAAGLRVGDHVAPKSTDGKIVTPCVVLYLTPSAPPFGDLVRPGTDVLMRFMLTSVDLTADGAQDYADRVFDAIDGATLSVVDRYVTRVRRSSIAGVERDDDVQPPCYYAATPYQLLSMSAADSGS